MTPEEINDASREALQQFSMRCARDRGIPANAFTVLAAQVLRTIRVMGGEDHFLSVLPAIIEYAARGKDFEATQGKES